MKRKILLTCLTTLGLFSVAEAQTAKWQSAPITIDGNADDWGGPIRFYNSDSRINYEFRNDAQNLYLIVKTSDQMMQRQMMIAGFKLKFKTKSEPTINASIAFAGFADKKKPLPDKDKMKERPKLEAQNAGSEAADNPDIQRNPDDMQMPPMANHKDTVKLDGFLYAPRNVIVGDDTQTGICISKTGFERAKEMAYEFKIPIREFAGDNFNLDKFSETQIQLQILIDAPSGSRSGGGRSGMGMRGGMGGPGGGMGGPGGGMGGGPGGGGDMGGMGGGPGGDEMGGGMGQGPGDEMSQGSSMSAKKINAKFTLATKPQ